MLVPLIPAIATGLDTTVGLVAGAITAYMIPFASLQLVSGTIAERVGAVKIVRVAYLVFGTASLVAALAPEIWTLVAARAVTGGANAFVTPVLLAALSETVPQAVLGRTVGTFAAVQVAGLTLAPALGGALGEVTWRLGFGLVAAVAFALILTPLRVTARHAGRPRARLRSLLNGRLALVCAKAATGYLGFTAIGFLVTLVCVEMFGLGYGLTGLIVSSYGIGGMLLGRYAGAVVDRAGRPRTALFGVAICGAGVLGLAFVPDPVSFALVYFVVGCGSAFAWAGLNTIVVERFPENRAGSVSAYSAFKFLGVAVAPVLYVPLYGVDPSLPFLVAAAFSCLCALLLLPWIRTYEQGSPP